jgi:hypothetical protein
VHRRGAASCCSRAETRSCARSRRSARSARSRSTSPRSTASSKKKKRADPPRGRGLLSSGPRPPSRAGPHAVRRSANGAAHALERVGGAVEPSAAMSTSTSSTSAKGSPDFASVAPRVSATPRDEIDRVDRASSSSRRDAWVALTPIGSARGAARALHPQDARHRRVGRGRVSGQGHRSEVARAGEEWLGWADDHAAQPAPLRRGAAAGRRAARSRAPTTRSGSGRCARCSRRTRSTQIMWTGFKAEVWLEPGAEPTQGAHLPRRRRARAGRQDRPRARRGQRRLDRADGRALQARRRRRGRAREDQPGQRVPPALLGGGVPSAARRGLLRRRARRRRRRRVPLPPPRDRVGAHHRLRPHTRRHRVRHPAPRVRSARPRIVRS